MSPPLINKRNGRRSSLLRPPVFEYPNLSAEDLEIEREKRNFYFTKTPRDRYSYSDPDTVSNEGLRADGWGYEEKVPENIVQHLFPEEELLKGPEANVDYTAPVKIREDQSYKNYGRALTQRELEAAQARKDLDTITQEFPNRGQPPQSNAPRPTPVAPRPRDEEFRLNQTQMERSSNDIPIHRGATPVPPKQYYSNEGLKDDGWGYEEKASENVVQHLFPEEKIPKEPEKKVIYTVPAVSLEDQSYKNYGQAKTQTELEIDRVREAIDTITRVFPNGGQTPQSHALGFTPVAPRPRDEEFRLNQTQMERSSNDIPIHRGATPVPLKQYYSNEGNEGVRGSYGGLTQRTMGEGEDISLRGISYGYPSYSDPNDIPKGGLRKDGWGYEIEEPKDVTQYSFPENRKANSNFLTLENRVLNSQNAREDSLNDNNYSSNGLSRLSSKILEDEIDEETDKLMRESSERRRRHFNGKLVGNPHSTINWEEEEAEDRKRIRSNIVVVKKIADQFNRDWQPLLVELQQDGFDLSNVDYEDALKRMERRGSVTATAINNGAYGNEDARAQSETIEYSGLPRKFFGNGMQKASPGTRQLLAYLYVNNLNSIHNMKEHKKKQYNLTYGATKEGVDLTLYAADRYIDKYTLGLGSGAVRKMIGAAVALSDPEQGWDAYTAINKIEPDGYAATAAKTLDGVYNSYKFGKNYQNLWRKIGSGASYKDVFKEYANYPKGDSNKAKKSLSILADLASKVFFKDTRHGPGMQSIMEKAIENGAPLLFDKVARNIYNEKELEAYKKASLLDIQNPDEIYKDILFKGFGDVAYEMARRGFFINQNNRR